MDVFLYNEPDVREYLFKSFKKIIQRGVNGRTELSIRALLRRSRILSKCGWAGRKGKKAIFALLRIYDALERKLLLSREQQEQTNTAANQ